MRTYVGKNAKYNCDINLCLEDILNLKDCMEKTKKMGWNMDNDFYPVTLMDIICTWEEKIGKTVDECNKED